MPHGRLVQLLEGSQHTVHDFERVVGISGGVVGLLFRERDTLPITANDGLLLVEADAKKVKHRRVQRMPRRHVARERLVLGLGRLG